MKFTIFFKDKNIGSINLDGQSFDASAIETPKERKKLSQLLDNFYKNGVQNIAFADDANRNTVTIAENEKIFFLELSIKLKELGYTVK